MSGSDQTSERIGIAAGDGLGASALLMDSVLEPILRLSGMREDGFRLATCDAERVITTDVFSVDPIIFPGGNIGSLAAAGVCNDLLASGADVREIALGVYASANLETATLRECLESFNALVEPLGAQIVCGDTKVHPSSKPELLLFATALGTALSKRRFDLADTRAGDDIIITGALGDHAIAVLSAREGLGFESTVTSDARPLHDPIAKLVAQDLVHSLRDLTRGGLTAALWDGYRATKLEWAVYEKAVPVHRPVRAAAEMLGLDVLTLTNEGCMLITCESEHRETVMEVLRSCPSTAEAAVIGTVREERDGVGPVLVGPLGGPRVLVLPHGIGVPRLC
jgi:hydrogenase expression/formation protein HypE